MIKLWKKQQEFNDKRSYRSRSFSEAQTERNTPGGMLVLLEAP